MTVRSRYWLAAALGLSLVRVSPTLHAQPTPGEPARFGLAPGGDLPAARASANQQTADTIAAHLRQSGQLRHYTVDIVFRDGTAEVSGSVADQSQREEVLRIAQGVPGVERVVDRLRLPGPVTQAQATDQPPGRLPAPLPQGSTLPPPTPSANGRPATEPVPIFQGAGPSPYDLNPPKMPPYAWPTYAPHNNYSRVAQPMAYPYNAWPFIGPIYPFPKIPLGWRSVKLEWDDGYWWFSKVATKYDWWRLRYW
jgi:hypothetical protein